MKQHEHVETNAAWKNRPLDILDMSHVMVPQHGLIQSWTDWSSPLISVQIYLPRPEASEPPLVSVPVKYGFAIITSFNITDPNSTVVVSANPDRNVSLLVLLSPTYQSNNRSLRTILTGRGKKSYHTAK